MARHRTQKAVAARIDRDYVHRLHRWRRSRLALTFTFTTIAILFGVLVTFGGAGERIQNPGRLASVHANFQNNCAACHDGCDAKGKPTGKFNRAVSDTACLSCHDAAIHHPNQATMVINDTTQNPPRLRSSDCATCHVEHRGQSALVSTTDLMCVQCHNNITGKLKDPIKAAADKVPLTVTSFTLDTHPTFGRSLKVNGVLTDPTAVSFNHKIHIVGDPAKGDKPKIDDTHAEMRNCTFCHDPSPAASQGMVWENGKSAFSMPDGDTQTVPAPLIDGSGRHRSMTQINFDKDCKVCHDLGTLPDSDIAIPHGQMGEVRKAILAYVTDGGKPYLKSLDPPTAGTETVNDRMIAKYGDVTSMPDLKDKAAADKRKADVDAVVAAITASPLSATVPTDPNGKLPQDVVTRLVTAAGKLSASIVPAKDKAAVSGAVAATTQPATELRPLVIANLQKEAVRGVTGNAKNIRQLQFNAAFARYSHESPDPRILELYVAYENGKVGCVKCHDIQGDAASVPTEWASMFLSPAAPDAPAPKPAATPDAAGPYRTKPTGIPAGPRRWYVNSEFNHDAHRRMECIECHTAALTSEKTSDILSPDITWQGLAPESQRSTKLIPATRSCIECHHPDNSDGPGAASNCTECHVYHDRSHEQLPKPADSMGGPTTMPAVSMAK